MLEGWGDDGAVDFPSDEARDPIAFNASSADDVEATPLAAVVPFPLLVWMGSLPTNSFWSYCTTT